MKITSIQVHLPSHKEEGETVLAYVSVVFEECFKVNDLKIIQAGGRLFVAMPSRKLTFPCPQCSNKNGFNANFCNSCGVRLESKKLDKAFRDIAHPCHDTMRRYMADSVMQAYLNSISKEE